MDEDYVDVSAALLEWEWPSAIGTWVHAQVAECFHVACSVGIVCNKLVSEMTSTNIKPGDVLLIPVTRSAEFMQMIPLRGISRIGSLLEKRLSAWSVHSVAESARLDEAALIRAIGSSAVACGLWATSHGSDSRKITTVRGEKSVGSEETLAEDMRDIRVVYGLLRSACDEAISMLRRKGLVARMLTVKLWFTDLSYQTRSFMME